MRSIFFTWSSVNVVVKKASASTMKAPAPIGARVVNSARGSSANAASMLHHLQGVDDLAVGVCRQAWHPRKA